MELNKLFLRQKSPKKFTGTAPFPFSRENTYATIFPGVCTCDSGWEAEDCSVSPSLPPQIDIDAEITINQKNELVILGSNFVASLQMTCIFTEVKVT